jgi:hypothetical protein
MDATGCISRQPRNPQRCWRDSQCRSTTRLPVTSIRLPSRCLSAPARFLNCIERPPVSTTTGESLNKTLSSSRFCHPRKTVFPAPSRRPPFQCEFRSEPAMDFQFLLAVSSATHRPVANTTLCPRRVPQPQNPAGPFPKAQSTGRLAGAVSMNGPLLRHCSQPPIFS